jgi:integrase
MGYVFRQRGRHIFSMKYYVRGVPIIESTGTDDEKKALKILHAKETDRDRGMPVGPTVGTLRFADAVKGIETDFANNNRKSWPHVERRIRLHLDPVFRGWKMADIRVANIKAYTMDRRAAGASAGTVNRELAVLKRMFTLAVQGELLLHRPHFPMLDEKGRVRSGFFEWDAFDSVRRHLPAALQPVMTVAYVSGWRIDSEVLPLEWRQVDLPGRQFSLDASQTKNQKPRVFPMTPDLYAVFVARQAARDAVLAQGQLCPWVFFRLVAKGRGGPTSPKRIKRFQKAWAAACQAAGQPGKIPHDFRRTAIRNMVRRGVPERVAMQLTGHLTRSVFERYNIVSPGDLHDAAARLEGLSEGVKPLTGNATGNAGRPPAAAPATPRKSLRKFGGAARI